MPTKVLSRAAIGFVVGMLMGVLVVLAESFAAGGTIQLPQTLLDTTGSEAGALLAQMLLSGVYGIVPMAGTVLYELDKWGLAKQAIVHYMSYMLTFLVVGTLAGWFVPTLVVVGVFAGSFALCHLVIWLIMFMRYKAEVRRLNELLQNGAKRD